MWDLRHVSGLWGIISGIAVPALWVYFIKNGMYPELHATPIAASLHLTAEFGMAAVSLISGLALYQGRVWATRVFVLSLGVMLHAELVSLGRLAQQGATPFAAGFVGILAATLLLTIFNLKSKASC